MDKREQTWTVILGLFIAGMILVTIKGGSRVIRFGKTFIGQEELSGNSGFKSEKLQEMMAQVGWRRGDAWCVYFAKMIWYNMAPRALRPLILRLVSGNSQQAYKNLSEDRSGAFRVTKFPKRGDMVIWQWFKDGAGQWKGHAGIVTRVDPAGFMTIEGNTNTTGGREGYIVGEKERGYDFDKQNGLRLKGFITFA